MEVASGWDILEVQGVRRHSALTFVALVLLFAGPQLAWASGNPIGFEELDNGTVWHIWNTEDDYYFNATSGIQFTNHYNEYWAHNIFCGQLQ